MKKLFAAFKHLGQIVTREPYIKIKEHKEIFQIYKGIRSVDRINYYHEAGHTLIAYLFQDIFIIEYVTLDQAKSKMNDLLSMGGLKTKLSKRFIELLPWEHDIIVLELFAGYIADSCIYNYRLNENFSMPEFWASKIAEDRYSGDVGYMNNHLIEILPEIKLSQIDYFSNCIIYLDDFFRIEEVSLTLDVLATALFDKQNNTLTIDELKDIFESTGILIWWQEYRNAFLAGRESIFIR